jgi:hypothetical protein
VISFAGIGLIASGQPGGLSFGAGASLVLAAAGCPAAYFILQRPLVPPYGALTCTAHTLLAGALLLASRLPETLGGLAAPRAATATIWSAARAGRFASRPPLCGLGLCAWSLRRGQGYELPLPRSSRRDRLAFLMAGEEHKGAFAACPPPSQSDQAQQQRAPEEENQEGDR